MKPFLYEGTYVCYPMITIVEANRTIRNDTLQHIVLFDLAETDMGLGQVNFRKTSSFCSKGNFVHGINYTHPSLEFHAIGKEFMYDFNGIDINDYNRWDNVNKNLINGNIKPGAHICCAGEWEFGTIGDNLYAGVGIAVPEDKKNAILFMECVGKTIEITRETIREDIIESIVQIGKNQNIKYKEIYVVTDEKTLQKDLGCAMVTIPYFLIEKIPYFLKEK